MPNDVLSMVRKMPPWVIAFAVVAILVLAVLLFISKTNAGCIWGEGRFSCGFDLDKTQRFTEPRKFHGYYYNWSDKGEVNCSSETVTLRFSVDEKVIEGQSVGNVVMDNHGTSAKNSWTLRGFNYGNKLALAYVTEKTPVSGNGIYYLIKEQGEYAGFWIGVNSPSNRIIRCPYLLTTVEKPANEICEQRWPRVFNSANTCQEVAFSETTKSAFRSTAQHLQVRHP